MSRSLVYRSNRLFKIDLDQLPTKARTTPIINAMYADIYTEFLDAQVNDKYSSMTISQRMQAVNDFALNWLTNKGFNNG